MAYTWCLPLGLGGLAGGPNAFSPVVVCSTTKPALCDTGASCFPYFADGAPAWGDKEPRGRSFMAGFENDSQTNSLFLQSPLDTTTFTGNYVGKTVRSGCPALTSDSQGETSCQTTWGSTSTLEVYYLPTASAEANLALATSQYLIDTQQLRLFNPLV